MYWFLKHLTHLCLYLCHLPCLSICQKSIVQQLKSINLHYTRARSQIGFERNLTFPICPTIRCGVKHWHVFTLNMDKDHQEYQRMVRFCCCGRSAKNFLVFKKAFLFLKFPLEMGYFLWNFSKPLWNALKGLGSNRQNWNVSVHHFFLQMTAHFVLFYSTSKLWNKMTGLKLKVFFRSCHIW